MADTTPLADAPIALRDFRIDSASLISASGVTTDISTLIVELIVRQDIFTNYMHGEAIVAEGIDLFTGAGLHGSEYLYLNIYEPEIDTRINKAFRVFKITDRTTSGANMQRYKIHFVSDEMFVSNIKLISKSYKGETISTIAESIINDYLNSGKYFVEPTDIATDYIISNKRPTEALNWLASHATSGDKNSFLFFENLDGLNFKSLHTIYEEPPCNSNKIRFESKSANPQLGRNKFSIDSFTAIRDFDVITLSANGGVCMRMLGVDPYHRTFKINDYDVNSVRKMHDIPPISNITDMDNTPLYEHYESNQIVYPQFEDTPSSTRTNSEKYISRKLQLALIRNSLMDIVLPGNMIIQAGKMIDLEIPHMIPATEKNMQNDVRSGTYLVVSVAHKFNMVDFTFDTIATLSRDSYPVAPIEADTQLTSKVHDING